MENNHEERFVKNEVRAAIGCVNGILAYDLVWPFLVVAFLRLILPNYSELVQDKYETMSLIVMIIMGLITITASIFIAGPRRLCNAFKGFNGRCVKYVVLTFLVMLGFNYTHNLLLLLGGVDIGGGTTNQELVVNMITKNPLLSLISMTIIAPLNEELTYRYFLFGGIRKWNDKWAIVLSGFIFMLVHGMAGFTSDDADIVRELLLLPPYMFSGMAIAFAYNKTKSISTSLGIHVLNNVVSFILTLL